MRTNDESSDDGLALRREVIDVCRKLIAAGVNQGTAGNVSVRHGDRFLITPSGVPYEAMTPDQIADMRADGAWFGPRVPTSEWRFHREIMRRRSDVAAIVHTHSMYATAVAMLRRDLPAVHYYIFHAGGPSVRCATYATFGTQELAEHALIALDGRMACLLANHGMIVLGTSLADAYTRTFELETLARQYVYAASAGEPYVLESDEIERVRVKMQGYGKQDAPDADLVRRERAFDA